MDVIDRIVAASYAAAYCDLDVLWVGAARLLVAGYDVGPFNVTYLPEIVDY